MTAKGTRGKGRESASPPLLIFVKTFDDRTDVSGIVGGFLLFLPSRRDGF